MSAKDRESIPLHARERTPDRLTLLALGRGLRNMRTLFGLTQEDLVVQCAQDGPGIGRVTADKVNKWETGQSSIGVADLFEVSAVLGPFWTWPVPMDDVELTAASRKIQEIFA